MDIFIALLLGLIAITLVMAAIAVVLWIVALPVMMVRALRSQSSAAAVEPIEAP